MFLSARNCWMLSISSPVTFQTSPNLWWLQTLSFFMSNELVTIWTVNQRLAYTSCFPCLTLSQFCLLKASYSWSHLSPSHDPLWTSCKTQKHMYMPWCYLHSLTEAFQVFVMEIFSKNFWFIHCSDFILRSSEPLTELPKKRRCQLRYVKKKRQWLQKAKITVRYSQHIQLGDNVNQWEW